MQAPELHRLVPAQPAGARAALEDPRLPAHQRQPLALVFRHIAQPAPGQLLEPQIVVFGHQRIPARPLVRLRQPQHHLLQIRNLCGRLLLLHTPCIHESGQNSQPLAYLVVRMVTPPRERISCGVFVGGHSPRRCVSCSRGERHADHVSLAGIASCATLRKAAGFGNTGQMTLRSALLGCPSIASTLPESSTQRSLACAWSPRDPAPGLDRGR